MKGQEGGAALPAVCQSCVRGARCFEGCKHRKERLAYELCALAREIREKLQSGNFAWKPADIRRGLRR